MNLFIIAAKGGYLMLVLLLLSIASITIIIERFITIAKARKQETEFWQEIFGYLSENQINKAQHLCEIKQNPAAEMVAKGLQSLPFGHQQVQETLDTAARSEIHKLEKNLGILSTIAAIAPLVGFLGTVTGMVKVFMEIQGTGGGVDISLLAGGIWEALITTIGGLIVGIIAIMFYNYLVGLIENIAQNMEELANNFILKLRRIQNENLPS